MFADYLASSKKILLFTGAGVSTGSGIPDYRGPSGRWKTDTPVYYGDFMTSESERLRYWRQKTEAWERFRDARPTRAHEAVVRLEEAGKLLMVVTQNIDGLHRRARVGREALSPERIVELHGTMHEVECQSCRMRRPSDPYYEEFGKRGIPPVCACGGFLKPGTISFGQSLRSGDLSRAFEGAGACDLVVSLGSTLMVTPAADVPLTAASRGIPYIIVNRGVTAHDGLPQVTLRLEGDVEDIFPQAVDEALGRA